MRKTKVVRNLIWAEFCSTPDFIRPTRHRGRRALGVKYEVKMHEKLRAEFGHKYFSNPWIKYQTKGGPLQWCQPDALVVDIPEGIITILEMKYSHTFGAYGQVMNMYLPLIKKIFGKNFTYRTCEVTRWYDPSEYFPKPHKLIPNLKNIPEGVFGVHIRRA